jgi:hypothetical protein
MLGIGRFLKKREERLKQSELLNEKSWHIKNFLERMSSYLEHSGCNLIDATTHYQYEPRGEYIVSGTLTKSSFSSVYFFVIEADQNGLTWKVLFDRFFLDYPLTKILVDEISKRFKTTGAIQWDNLNGEIPEGIAIKIFNALYYSEKLISQMNSELEKIESEINKETEEIKKERENQFASLVSGLHL